MATIERFEDLEVWKTARALTNTVYDLTDQEPFSRDYGLKDQIRRASVSVMSNVAEGFESRTQALFVEFLGRAKGSAGEVRCQLYIALDRRYVSPSQFVETSDLAEKASRQIHRMMEYLKSRPNASRLREEDIEYPLEGCENPLES